MDDAASRKICWVANTLRNRRAGEGAEFLVEEPMASEEGVVFATETDRHIGIVPRQIDKMRRRVDRDIDARLADAKNGQAAERATLSRMAVPRTRSAGAACLRCACYEQRR